MNTSRRGVCCLPVRLRAQGGDFGAAVTDVMGRPVERGPLGIRLNPFSGVPQELAPGIAEVRDPA